MIGHARPVFRFAEKLPNGPEAQTAEGPPEEDLLIRLRRAVERGSAPLGWDTYLAILMVLGAHGVLEPRGRDAERLAATGRLIGGRIRF